MNQKLHALFMRTKKSQGGPADKARGKRAKILLQNLQEILLFFSYASQNLFSLFSKHVKNSVIVFGEIVSNVAGIIFI
ncbi:MAG: hypothetical protein WA130_08270 [Candidatus Methanoperedens sp.]